MRLVACGLTVDPGKMTGYIRFNVYRTEGLKPVDKIPGSDSPVYQNRLIAGYAIEMLEHGAIGYDEYVDKCMRLVRATTQSAWRNKVPSMVICEDFIITNTAQRGASTWSLKLIGATQLAAHYCGTTVFDSSQKSADAKTVVRDPVLRDIGFTGKQLGHKLTEHEKDAMRHAILAVARLRTKKLVLNTDAAVAKAGKDRETVSKT